jgi:hypothetical protein
VKANTGLGIMRVPRDRRFLLDLRLRLLVAMSHTIKKSAIVTTTAAKAR